MLRLNWVFCLKYSRLIAFYKNETRFVGNNKYKDFKRLYKFSTVDTEVSSFLGNPVHNANILCS